MNRHRLSSFFGVRGLSTLFWLVAVLFCASPAWAAAPNAPTLLRSMVTSSGQLNLYWDDNSNDETGFELIVSESGDTPYYIPISPGWSGCAFNGFPTNFPVTFAVRSYKGSEASAPSNTISVNVSDGNPPSCLEARMQIDGPILLTWADNALFESGYIIEYRALPNGSWSPWTDVGENSCAISLVLEPWMTPGTSYEFRVIGFQEIPDSPTLYTDYSPTARVDIPQLVAPTNFTATPSATSPYQISFSWTDNSISEQGYELEFRKQNLSSPQAFTTWLSTYANVTSLNDVPDFEPGTIYEFRVRAFAYDALGYKTFSNPAPASGGVVAITKNGFSSKPYAPITFGADFNFQVSTKYQGSLTNLTVGTLPSGLTYNPASGFISGTATASGAFIVPLDATFSDGSSHSQLLALRVIRPPAPPRITAPIAAQTLTQSGSTVLSLASNFDDLDTESAVRLVTSQGTSQSVLDLVLYSSATPQTVANFLSYLNGDKYNETIFHRSPMLTVEGTPFVLQGGGYKFVGESTVTHIDILAPVVNEPGISNVLGTLAMAKIGGDPNSATSEFFINLSDNSYNSASLDVQNGGFTVFGRVSAPSLSGALTALANIPAHNTDLYYYDPIQNTTTVRNFDSLPYDENGFVPRVTSWTSLEVLTYSIVVAPDSAVATATLSGSALSIHAVASGTTSITVGATDVDGNTTTQTFPVTVQKTLANWAAEQGLTGPQTAPGAIRPDGLTNLHAFAFVVDPAHPAPARMPAFAVKTDGATRRTEITFPVRKYAAGVTYAVEASSTLVANDWTTIWTSANGFNAPAVSGAVDQPDHTLITVGETQGATPAPKRFLRVKLTGP